MRRTHVEGETPRPASIFDLIPENVTWIVWQLWLVVLLVALWKGRRVGPLVAEELPVVVRASETVEGRGRLYRSRRARDRAAEALRTATLQRLVPRLGLGPNAHRAGGGDDRGPAQRGRRGICFLPPVRPTPATDNDLLNSPVRSTKSKGRSHTRDTVPVHRRQTPRSQTPPVKRCWRYAAEIAKAVVGQEGVISGLVIALLCRGHVLLEGVPGVAKTLMIRALAAALQLEFKRVQFTPDLMPGDVTGSLVYDTRTAEFAFRPGPVFTNLLLADEINRTPPKTQAALLEAMEERQVSVDGEATTAARPVHRRRDPEPDRIRGHLPVARSPTRPLPAQTERDTAAARLRDRHPRPARARLRSPRSVRDQAGGRARRAGGRRARRCDRC